MKSFDELLAMTDEEKLAYLKEEEEKLIESANVGNVMKLRALQAKCDGVRNKYKDPVYRASKLYYTMHEAFAELNEQLKSFVGKR